MSDASASAAAAEEDDESPLAAEALLEDELEELPIVPSPKLSKAPVNVAAPSPRGKPVTSCKVLAPD
jgi:hypothetical protein